MDSYRISFLVGTASSILPNLPVEDIIVTLLMAMIGAVASFVVTVFLRKLGKWFKPF